MLLDERHIHIRRSGVRRDRGLVRGSAHEYRYRLALVVDGECVLRYDDEAGKGDHRHGGDKEYEYRFKNAEQLLADFWSDVEEMLK